MRIKTRKLKKVEENALYDILDDKLYGYRAQIVLLFASGYKQRDIWKATNKHPHTVRKWIKIFNRYGLKGLTRKQEKTNSPKFDSVVRKRIISIAETCPRELGLSFSTWSLTNLKIYLEKNSVVESICRETIRTILLCNGISWKKHKEILVSNDPQYELKKKRVLKLYKNKPKNAVVICQDEKGPIAAKEAGV